MAGPNISQLSADLIRDEGWRNYSYQDTLGRWTIGVGHCDLNTTDGMYWTDERIKAQLDADISGKIAECQTQSWWAAVADDEVRCRAMVNMCFQLGVGGVAKFRLMVACLSHKEWPEAAEEALDSKWAAQTPARASRIAHMLEYGVDV